jgi:hypothetical protein
MTLIEKAAPSPGGCHSRAIFSECMKYRYCLERTWDSGAASLAFILLNPSTADEIVNDPTIERCERRARQACFGGIVVCNLFAWRATDPAALRKVEDPIGPDNDLILDRLLGPKKKTPDNIICGWGAHGAYRGRKSADD